MQWDCHRQGCFNLKKRPKIEVFDECFSGSVAFGDVDAVVERNGRFLFLEWKSPGADLSVGQRILYERLTAISPHITVVVVGGDAETMAVSEIRVIHRGSITGAKASSIDGLKRRISSWYKRATDMR